VPDWPDPRIRQTLEQEFAPGARRELLMVLTSPSHVRADLIGQCFRRAGATHLGELLIDLEEDDFLRAAFIQTLRQIDYPLSNG
jgi:hypothetical protein